MAKILVVFYLLFSTCNSLAQTNDKKNFIGIFQNNAFGGDTVSGYIFLSLDSFRIVYTINTEDGTDFRFPIETGTWTMNSNVLYFKYDNGIVVDGKIDAGTFETGPMTGSIPMINIKNKEYSNLSHAHKSSIE